MVSEIVRFHSGNPYHPFIITYDLILDMIKGTKFICGNLKVVAGNSSVVIKLFLQESQQNNMINGFYYLESEIQ